MSRYDRDGFGLPIKRNEVETALELQWRQAETKRQSEIVIHALFRKLQHDLGDREARKLFAPYAPAKPRRKPGSHGRRDEDKSEFLIRSYDRVFEHHEQKDKVPRIIAEHVYKNYGSDYGNSPQAIEKQLRRLLKDRDVRAPYDAEPLIQEMLASIRRCIADEQSMLPAATCEDENGPTTA